MNGSANAPSRVLTAGALNRATLARQMLLERADVSPLVVLERIIGLQAQTPRMWYVGLWDRLKDFDPLEVSRLLSERRLVRVVLMRAQTHVVTAADAGAFRPLLQPVAVAAFEDEWGRSLPEVDTEAVAARAREMLAAGPLTMPEVGASLLAEHKGADPVALMNAARLLLPLVSVPPYGLWEASGPMAFTTAEAWLGRELGPMITPPELTKRYLAAFGPATAADIEYWSGLPGLGDLLRRQRAELETFRDVHGQEVFDLPGAPRPDPDVPAPVRYLYDCDSLLASYADVSRFIGPAGGIQLPNAAGQYFYGGVLIDGAVKARWRKLGSATGTSLGVEPFMALSDAEAADVVAEGRSLLRFLEPRAEGDVDITAPLLASRALPAATAERPRTRSRLRGTRTSDDGRRHE